MSKFENNENGLCKMTLTFQNDISVVVNFQEPCILLMFGGVIKEAYEDMSVRDFGKFIDVCREKYGELND